MVPHEKRFSSFTLRRTPFWFFCLAGVSVTTLTPLFVSADIATALNCLAIAAVITMVAARFRDIGCSAWFTPLAVIPLIAIFAGVTASDDQAGHPGNIEYRVIGTTLASFTLFASWVAYLVV